MVLCLQATFCRGLLALAQFSGKLSISLPHHRWIFCWLPSVHSDSCVLGWKETSFGNYKDLVLTLDDLIRWWPWGNLNFLGFPCLICKEGGNDLPVRDGIRGLLRFCILRPGMRLAGSINKSSQPLLPLRRWIKAQAVFQLCSSYGIPVLHSCVSFYGLRLYIKHSCQIYLHKSHLLFD